MNLTKYRLSAKKAIFHIEFDTQYQVTSTMARVQEYYESPYKEIRNNVFSLERFLDVYGQSGKFDYFTSWAGFNIPGYIFIDWEDKFSKIGFLDKEHKLLNLLEGEKYKSLDKFYVIATHKEDSALEHELAHALFYLDSKYEESVLKVINNMSGEFVKEMTDILISRGYCDSKLIIKDEINAFMSTSDCGEFNATMSGEWGKYILSSSANEEYPKYREELVSLFNAYERKLK